MKHPQKDEYTEYHEQYIRLIPGDNVIRALESQMLELQALVSDLPSDKEDYAYAPGKWTIKEVIGHLIDCERVFGYRVLRAARGDDQSLPGFDDKMFVPAGKFNKRSFYDLAHEFSVLREANIILFKSLDEEALSRSGTADGHTMTVRAHIFSIAGHAAHHVRTIKSRYLD